MNYVFNVTIGRKEHKKDIAVVAENIGDAMEIAFYEHDDMYGTAYGEPLCEEDVTSIKRLFYVTTKADMEDTE